MSVQRTLIRTISSVGSLLQVRDEITYLDALVSGVRTLQATYPNATFAFAGHSLGGGLSAIAGQLLGIPSVSISGPGSVLTGAKLGVEPSPDNYNGAMVIVPDFDVVPRVDSNVGTVQNIACMGSTSAAKCHTCLRTCCHLADRCGDPYGRRFLGCDALRG